MRKHRFVSFYGTIRQIFIVKMMNMKIRYLSRIVVEWINFPLHTSTGVYFPSCIIDFLVDLLCADAMRLEALA